jgi:hypothetical protein
MVIRHYRPPQDRAGTGTGVLIQFLYSARLRTWGALTSALSVKIPGEQSALVRAAAVSCAARGPIGPGAPEGCAKSPSGRTRARRGRTYPTRAAGGPMRETSPSRRAVRTNPSLAAAEGSPSSPHRSEPFPRSEVDPCARTNPTAANPNEPDPRSRRCDPCARTNPIPREAERTQGAAEDLIRSMLPEGTQAAGSKRTQEPAGILEIARSLGEMNPAHGRWPPPLAAARRPGGEVIVGAPGAPAPVRGPRSGPRRCRAGSDRRARHGAAVPLAAGQEFVPEALPVAGGGGAQTVRFRGLVRRDLG